MFQAMHHYEQAADYFRGEESNRYLLFLFNYSAITIFAHYDKTLVY